MTKEEIEKIREEKKIPDHFAPGVLMPDGDIAFFFMDQIIVVEKEGKVFHTWTTGSRIERKEWKP